MGWLFERWCCAWADLVLVQSREDERVLPRARICPARKLRFVGNGVMLDRFLAAAPPGRAAASSRPVVLMVSRLVREKGCWTSSAWPGPCTAGPTSSTSGRWRPTSATPSPSAEISAAADDVTFVGAVDDIRPYLAAADVVVLPSYREGMPRVAMEAAAAGRPVVAYDVRGVREVVDPSSGLLVPRGDTAARSPRSWTSLLDDPERRADARPAAPGTRVLERFSEDDVIARLRGVYAELAGAA